MRRGTRQPRAVTMLGMAVILALSAALMLSLPPGAANAQDVRYFRIGTGSSSGTYFPVGSLIAGAISNPPGSRPCERGGSCGIPGVIAIAQATSGGIANLDLLRSGALEAALVQANLASWAYSGTDYYRGRPPLSELRAIATLYTETVQIVVRADSPIRTIRDLRRRRISVGEAGSAIAIDAPMVLRGLGLTDKAYTPVNLRPEPSVDALIDGKIDALFLVAGAPFAAISDAAARVPIRLIAITPAEVGTLKNDRPIFAEAVVPADTYPGVPEVATLGVGALLVVRAALDETLAYDLTKALWNSRNRRALEAGFPRGQFLPLPAARDTGVVPLHPGAERFYTERASPPPFQ